MSANDELTAHLAVIAEHAQAALKLLGGAENSGLALPKGSRACAHPENLRQRMMGGYWTCDPLKGGCGAKGRDTDMKGAP